MRKIFFDLDGTLFDSKTRLYKLFQHLVPSSTLSFNNYWDLKQNKVGHEQILIEKFGYQKEQFQIFTSTWLELIEEPEWLALDTPFEGINDFLLEAKKKNTLYVVTSRQFKNLVNRQLRSYELDSLFADILVTEQKKEKAELIRTLNISPQDWIVGDTGMDIKTGKSLGLKTCAVLTGFLNRKSLLEYKPDILVDKVLDFNYK